MEYMQLGNTELQVSRIGFGCWAIGGHGWGGNIDDQVSISAIKQAVDLGINFFDTADVYGFGHSEEILSKALGSNRHDVVIATKFGVSWDKDANIGRNSSPKYVLQALENSLRRLRIDCIPLYQIHWPDYNTPINETLETLKKCQEQGKIRHIGVSNFNLEQVKDACEFGQLESIQAPYSLINREMEKNILDFTSKNKLSVIVYDALAKGLLTGKFNLDYKFSKDDVRSKDSNFIGEKFKRNLELVNFLKEIGLRYNKSPGQVALRWILDNQSVTTALTGIKKPEQIKENIGALNWSLADKDREVLSNLISFNQITGGNTNE